MLARIFLRLLVCSLPVCCLPFLSCPVLSCPVLFCRVHASLPQPRPDFPTFAAHTKRLAFGLRSGKLSQTERKNQSSSRVSGLVGLSPSIWNFEFEFRMTLFFFSFGRTGDAREDTGRNLHILHIHILSSYSIAIPGLPKLVPTSAWLLLLLLPGDTSEGAERANITPQSDVTVLLLLSPGITRTRERDMIQTHHIALHRSREWQCAWPDRRAS
ncbi:hypothetical protein AA313_de0208141 [Arthrobotrys entomopaga]|nr:hypothetical protein AA313_de0208141 [Arthrobotrys entomopaga]